MNRRQKMCFTQQELAGFLGVERTQVAKAEKGKRALPYRALAQWARVRRLLEDEAPMEPFAAAVRAQHQQRVHLFITKQLRQLDHRGHLLQQRLCRMKTSYCQCIRQMALVAVLRRQGSMHETEAIPLNSLEARAMKKSWECGPDRQAELSIRLVAIACMEQELKALQERIS